MMTRRDSPVFVQYDRVPGEDLTPRHEKADTREVWIYPFDSLPELMSFGWANARRVRELRDHEHESALEVVAVHSGIATYQTSFGQVELCGGQLVILPPKTMHGGFDGAIQPCSQHWFKLWIPERFRSRYFGVPNAEGVQLYGKLRDLPHGVYRLSRDTPLLLDRMASVLREPGSDLLNLQSRALVLSLVIDLVSVVEASFASRDARPYRDPSIHNDSRLVRKCVELMTSRIESPASVEEFAEELGVSASHLKATFKKHKGVPPAEYFLRQRLHAAIERIRNTDDSLAAVAHRFGFGSSQYLATCCRRVLGRAPTDFRKRPTSILPPPRPPG